MSKKLRIRMYNVGFGDCFLLILPGKRTILVDAGFHSQGKGAFSGDEIAQQVIDDVTAISGKPRIDVVIATHRHADHVFSFNSEKWDEVEVGEVWLPWVEDRADKKATKLWKKAAAFAAQLAAAMPSFKNLDQADRDNVDFMLWNAGIQQEGMQGFDLLGAWSNKGALDRLHEGFASRDRARPRFLPEKEPSPESFETSVLPGVRIHVLGPPRNADLIEELDPEADGETYRALAVRAAMSGGLNGGLAATAPFGDIWQVDPREPGFTLDPDEILRLESLAQGADALLAAEKVDGMINSTSLVLVLQIGKARLLLPGDAEWGTWKHILKNEDARALLRGATFFKVGHHGSHNATSKSLVEKVLPKKIPAMVSTQEGKGNYRKNIPLKDMLDALTGREMRVVRSDRADGALPKGFKTTEAAKWVDLELPC